MTGLIFGAARAQRRREAMEDRYVLAHRKYETIAAVFDGHHGDGVAVSASSALTSAVLDVLALNPDFDRGAWARVFKALDAPSAECGSTATVLLWTPPVLHVGHVGDSRALLVRGDGHQVLTADHRVTTAAERQRVLGAGGTIHDGYVWCGARGLQVTRALGDKGMAAAGVIAEPATAQLQLGSEALAVVVATDGLWGSFGNQLVADLVRAFVGSGMPPGGIAAMLLHALDEPITSCETNGDNATILVGVWV